MQSSTAVHWENTYAECYYFHISSYLMSPRCLWWCCQPSRPPRQHTNTPTVSPVVCHYAKKCAFIVNQSIAYDRMQCIGYQSPDNSTRPRYARLGYAMHGMCPGFTYAYVQMFPGSSVYILHIATRCSRVPRPALCLRRCHTQENISEAGLSKPLPRPYRGFTEQRKPSEPSSTKKKGLIKEYHRPYRNSNHTNNQCTVSIVYA